MVSQSFAKKPKILLIFILEFEYIFNDLKNTFYLHKHLLTYLSGRYEETVRKLQQKKLNITISPSFWNFYFILFCINCTASHFCTSSLANVAEYTDF